MNKTVAVLLACMMLLSSCADPVETTETLQSGNSEIREIPAQQEGNNDNKGDIGRNDQKYTGESPTAEDRDSLDFTISGLDDEALLTYVKDNIYTTLVTDLNSDEYYIENVEAIYYPREYIEALASNSQPNLYFGYTAAELDEQFQGKRYVFTLGEDGQTIVVPMATISDDIYVKALEDVIIGSGVILVCVTVSAVTAPAAPAISMIFAVGASSGTKLGLSSGVISFVSAAIVKGYETESFEQALKAGVEAGGKGFKWSAIVGSATGGAAEAIALKGATLNGLSMNEAARIQRESGYPLSIIKQFHSVKEYTAYKNAGLQAEMIAGKLALVRHDIDLYNTVDEFGRNNYWRLSQGYNPIDASGSTFEWHHIGQNNDATLALLTSAEHDANALHGFKVVSEIDRVAFDKYKKEVLNKALLRWLLTSA